MALSSNKRNKKYICVTNDRTPYLLVSVVCSFLCLFVFFVSPDLPIN